MTFYQAGKRITIEQKRGRTFSVCDSQGDVVEMKPWKELPFIPGQERGMCVLSVDGIPIITGRRVSLETHASIAAQLVSGFDGTLYSSAGELWRKVPAVIRESLGGTLAEARLRHKELMEAKRRDRS